MNWEPLRVIGCAIAMAALAIGLVTLADYLGLV